MLTVTVAALLAVLGIVAVLAYVQKANQRAVQGMKAEYVLVAKQAIPSGTVVEQAYRGGLLTREQLPASSVPVDAVHTVAADISKLVTSAAIQPGQLLLREMLVPARQVTGAIAIPSGKVAVSVEVCLAAAVAGYVKPGSFVAVFDTYGSGKSQSQNLQQTCQGTHQAANAGTVFTRMVLPSVQVLSVTAAPPPQGSTSTTGTVVGGGASSSAIQGAVFVTLAASQKDAEKLILMSEAGLPYFALTTPNSGVATDAVPTQLFN